MRAFSDAANQDMRWHVVSCGLVRLTTTCWSVGPCSPRGFLPLPRYCRPIRLPPTDAYGSASSRASRLSGSTPHRLLLRIDIARADHVVPVRQAHTRVVVRQLVIPNTTRGFAQRWAAIPRAQRATGCPEIVCGLEPTGTYH